MYGGNIAILASAPLGVAPHIGKKCGFTLMKNGALLQIKYSLPFCWAYSSALQCSTAGMSFYNKITERVNQEGILYVVGDSALGGELLRL